MKKTSAEKRKKDVETIISYLWTKKRGVLILCTFMGHSGVFNYNLLFQKMTNYKMVVNDEHGDQETFS